MEDHPTLENSENTAAANPVPEATEDKKDKKKLLKSWPLWLGVGILAIAIGAGLDYRVYSGRKFNELVASIQAQELQATKNAVKVGKINTDINDSGSSADASPERLSQLQKELSSYKQLVAASCSGRASELTSQKVASKVKHLWLSGSQSTYISNAKTVLDQLSQSIYSNNGICKTSPVILGVDENTIRLLPGLVTIQKLDSNPNAPTDQQMQTLQAYINASVANDAALQKNVPGAADFYGSAYALFADLYDELKAVQSGNLSEALRYEAKATTDSATFSSSSDKAEKDVAAYGNRFNSPAIQAAKSEIALIDAQKQDSRLTAKLDYGVPVFWMLDSKLGQYTNAHTDNPAPKASSIQQLVSVLHDKDLTALNNRKLLQKASYASTGKDNSGSNLSVTLADGYKLTDNTPPSQ